MKNSFFKNSHKIFIISSIILLLIILSLVIKYNNNYSSLFTSKEPIELNLWNYYNGSQKISFDNLVTEFNQTVGLKKNIIINSYSYGTISELSAEIDNSIKGKAGSRNKPDIFSTYPDSAVEIDTMGMLAQLNTYMTDKEINEYIPSYIEEGYLYSKDNLKIFPVAKSTELLIINKTYFDKFIAETGADREDLKTWEGIARLSELYYNYSNGKSFFGRDAFANYMLVGSEQLGNSIFNINSSNVSFNFDRNTLKKLWDCYYVPYINGYFYEYGRFRTDDLKTGDIIAIVCSSSGIAYLPEKITHNDFSSEDIEIEILPVPNFQNCEPYAIQQGAGMAVIKSNSIKEKAAVEFLKWFTDVENNIKFSIDSSYTPVKKAALDMEAIHKTFESKSFNINLESVNKTFPICIEQLNNYNLYVAKPFIGANNSRAILNDSMNNKAKKDREEIIGLVSQGLTEKEAVSQFNTQENFDSWLTEFKSSLKSTIR